MIIRPMASADIPAIIHLGGRMHEESQYAALTYSPEKVAAFCSEHQHSQTSLCLVAADGDNIMGMLGGCVYPYQYGDEWIAIDILVYVAPEYRGSRAFIGLVRQYVAWAKAQGAKMIFLNQTTGMNHVEITGLYERLGFRAVGSNHCMEVA